MIIYNHIYLCVMLTSHFKNEKQRINNMTVLLSDIKAVVILKERQLLLKDRNQR